MDNPLENDPLRITTAAVPLEPIKLFSPTPKPGQAYTQPIPEPSSSSHPTSSQDPSALTPLRAHYLKRELVTLQFTTELETLSTPDALSLLGPPFLPKNQFINGLPISPSQPKSNGTSKTNNRGITDQQRNSLDRDRISSSSSSDGEQLVELPFLRFFFRHFVLSFPFLVSAPPSFFSHKLQPFIYSFFSRNISGTHDREEETKRRKIAGKVEKHLGLVMAAAIKLSDNQGQEQVVRVTADADLRPNDDDAFVPTPNIEPSSTLPDPHNPAGYQPPSAISAGPSGGFDVNIVAIRKVRIKGKVRTKIHEEFLIRTRSLAAGEVYVSRRYGDFVQLAEMLRVEFPDADIRGPPAKDHRATDGATGDIGSPIMSPPSGTSSSVPAISEQLESQVLSNEQPIPMHFSRERNRLTLRAYIHRLLSKSEISNSEHLKDFLIGDPIQLSAAEKQDVENREAMDRARDTEKLRFRMEVEGRVRELDEYLRAFREELVKSDGLSRVFGTIRKVDQVEKLPIEYRKVIEWARISLASTIYQVFLGSDNSSASFAQLKRMHGLMPYWAMRGVLKISNPVAMIRGILDLFLARPFGATSLVQRMFTSGLYDEIRELQEDMEKVAAKIDDDRMCERIKMYIEAPREIQEFYESEAKDENLDIMSIIMRSAEGPKFDNLSYQRIHRAAKAYDVYKAYRDGLEDPDSNEGPTNEDAWLFEDLHVYMKLMRRCRDKEQMIELIFEGTTSELLKDIVTIFYAPLMQVYKAANISDSLVDLQKFIDDLIRTVEKAEMGIREPHKVVQTFVDLVGRHEGAFYHFVHQVHTKGAGLFDGLMHWIELFVNFVRQGLSEPVSLETLLPHPGTTERLELMQEIDSIIDYHRKLKIAHHERMMRRLARGGEEAYEQNRDANFVAGVIDNLNLSKVVGADVGEVAHQDNEDSEESFEQEEPGSVDGSSPAANNAETERKKVKTPDQSIEPPNLRIVPTLTPLFTELVKRLLR